MRLQKYFASFLIAMTIWVTQVHAQQSTDAQAADDTPFKGSENEDVITDSDSTSVAEDIANEVNLDVVVVTGQQPGPRMWRVYKGEHVMWILGLQSPLPKRMQWDSANVERKIEASQEVLLAPSVTFDADVGFFRGLTLLPSFLKARKNPDGKTLRDVVPAEQYARWVVLKQRYIGEDRGVEQWRPLFAAGELYGKAISRMDMTQESIVAETVRKAAKRHKITTTVPKVEVKVTNLKSLLKEFAQSALDDTQCFEKTLQRIESDLGLMAERANAWAQGDVETLRNRPVQTQWAACNAALAGSAIARKMGVQDVEQRLQIRWLNAAETALEKNKVSFAVLPMSQLLSSDGYLSALAAKGYLIEPP